MNFKKMTKTKSISLVLLFMFFAQFLIGFPTAQAQEVKGLIEASVRVEGLNGTIIEGKDKGTNALDIFEKVLTSSKIDYTVTDSKYGKYIEKISDLKAGKLGAYSGWAYYVKNSKEIVMPQVGIDSYIPKNEDEIILYYTDFNVPAVVNSITFSPEVVKSKKPFTMKFQYSHYNYTSKATENTPIANAIVRIDNIQPMTTNEKGEITVQSLSKGEHSYKISGYAKDKLSTVVMDKGTFVIDDVNSPSFNHADASFDNAAKDTKNVVKNIDKDVTSTSNYMKSFSDNWTAMAMYKLGIKPDETFIKKYAEDIKKYGISELSNMELEKLIMGLGACGYTPYNFMGSNIPSELFNRDNKSFLIYDSIFGLETYNFANIKEQYAVDRKKLINNILENTIKYNFNGNEILGWSYSKNEKTIDPDTTAMGITALAPYYGSDANIKSIVDKAVKSLSILQGDNGCIGNNWGAYSETQAMTILALTSIGVNPEGPLFTKSKGDLVTALLSFKGSNGQFKHEYKGKDDNFATEQALRALIALKEYKANGKYDYYASNINSSELKQYAYNNESQIVNNNDNNNVKELPQTGTFIDNVLLVSIGLMLMIFGLVILRKDIKKI